MRRIIATLLAIFLTVPAEPAFAYLKFGTRVNGRQVTLKWMQTPVRYFVSSRSAVPGVSVDDFQAAVGRAFAQWQAVPTSAITYQFVGLTAGLPGEEDGLSTLGFRNRPELDRVLASTNFLVDISSGALLESDIFFNSSFSWSTAPAGELGRFDLESIALHEIGHLSGLGHSALGETELREGGGRRVLGAEAVMFPIAFGSGTIAGRTLKADDIAGISDLYPDGNFTASTGSISGTVTKDGQPVFGAHIVAFDPATGSMVATFSLNAQGQFSVNGLSPGPHVIRVEPLDDSEIDSFFDASLAVDIDFKVSFFDRLVVVAAGGDRGGVTASVSRK
jgi:Carboxypeptidase regulatory-like domain/Matrixin